MLNAPKNLYFHTQILCEAIRQPDTATPLSMLRYQQFIYENIVGVITQTFPLFSKNTSNDMRAMLVNKFLANHKATEPEFHHIATEFVRFVQQQNTVNNKSLCVLEYEWVLFCTEINTANVLSTHSTQLSESMLYQEIRLLENPTLQCIQLPFSIDQNNHSISFNDQDKLYYAIFRNSKHEVLCKQLSSTELYILDQIKTLGDSCYARLSNEMEFILLHQYLNNFNKINLITIND